MSSSGKKRALFGLHYIKYFYVVYLFIFEIFAFLIILISNNLKSTIYISLILLIISAILIFAEPWQWFI